MKKVSLISPCYNGSKYLKWFLDSLVEQTYQNVEFIFVNDGSTDSSPDILNSYKNKDSRFKIVTQKNQGLGKARNTGLKHAKGKWLIFVDADDFLLNDFFSVV